MEQYSYRNWNKRFVTAVIYMYQEHRRKITSPHRCVGWALDRFAAGDALQNIPGGFHKKLFSYRMFFKRIPRESKRYHTIPWTPLNI